MPTETTRTYLGRTSTVHVSMHHADMLTGTLHQRDNRLLRHNQSRSILYKTGRALMIAPCQSCEQ